MDQPHRRRSFAGSVTAWCSGVMILIAALATFLSSLSFPPVLTFVVILVLSLPICAWMIGRILRPLQHTLKGLAVGISSFQDRDFSMRLASHRQDELGDLARLYNSVGQTLQEERHEVRQKELLLSTALNRSPVAILLVNPQDRIIYGNLEAGKLLLGGGKLEGRSFTEIRDGCPAAMGDILSSQTDGLFTVTTGEHLETYHLAQRQLVLNRRQHNLILLHRITAELGRQEAEAWKKVIRVVCHELNNSLAPVSSLVHSAKTIAGQPDQAERFDEIFAVIHERLGHLKGFIEGYAKFARLPKPRKEPVDWQDLLDCLDEFEPVKVLGKLPSQPGYFDRAQMQQLLVNLLKNAVEASKDPAEVMVSVQPAADGGTTLQVLDRGQGMDEDTIKKSILPFYSTKTPGSGLGLPLCREIIEAHGGKMDLSARQGGGTIVSCYLPP